MRIIHLTQQANSGLTLKPAGRSHEVQFILTKEPGKRDQTQAEIKLCRNGLRAKPQLGMKVYLGRKESSYSVATYKLTEPQIESHGACWPHIDPRNDNSASGRNCSCLHLDR